MKGAASKVSGLMIRIFGEVVCGATMACESS
jgi:hypothetical protein